MEPTLSAVTMNGGGPQWQWGAFNDPDALLKARGTLSRAGGEIKSFKLTPALGLRLRFKFFTGHGLATGRLGLCGARFGSVRLGANVPLPVELAAGPLAILRATRLQGQHAGNVHAKPFLQSCCLPRQVVATLRQAVAKGGLPAKAPGVLGSGLPSGSLLSEVHGPVVVPVVASVAVREVDCGK